MPYRRTGRPPGRPRTRPLTTSITELERKAANARKAARFYQDHADEQIARELATGKTRRQVAAEINSTTGHVDTAVRRYRRKGRK
jgi:hypothetical protein